MSDERYEVDRDDGEPDPSVVAWSHLDRARRAVEHAAQRGLPAGAGFVVRTDR